MTILEQTITPSGPQGAIARSGVQVVACPTCDARFTFSRSDAPDIDACGFESYRLACDECGAALTGIIDPFDDTLLLCESAG